MTWITTRQRAPAAALSGWRNEKGHLVPAIGWGASPEGRVDVTRVASATPLQRATGAFGSLAMRSGVLFAAMLAASSAAADEPPLTIGGLLGNGWEIAGYASGYDNRTSLILFRKPGINALVQCSALYDVTRSPRTVVNCYELR
jgi:hypothetical protein